MNRGKWRNYYKHQILSAIRRFPDGISSVNLLNEVNMSPNTFYKYLEQLVEKGVVCKEVKSHKNVIYKPTEQTEAHYIFSEIMLSLARIFHFLGYSHNLPFFGLPIAFKDITEQKLDKLKNMLRQCVDLIDKYERLKS